jgi:hypothetical protein
MLIEPRGVVEDRLAASGFPHPSPLWPPLQGSPTTVQLVAALKVGGNGIDETLSLGRGKAIRVAQKAETLSSAPARETAAFGVSV